MGRLAGMDKVLVFDVWGDYAHFRRIETTTSPLTYLIPTGTSLAGLISAIIGLERDSYYEHFFPESTRFAIGILNPVKKIRINLSLIDTKRGFFLWDIKDNPRTLIPFEFLKEPKYRIYFSTERDRSYNKLKTCLEKHQSVYTPYLGITGLMANFEYINEYSIEASQKVKESVEIHSIVRRNKARLIIEEGKRYGLERIPLYMDKDRVVKEYADVFLEVNANPVKIMDGEYYRIENENVMFL
jgi:CRISPR-associated protein Cas5h